MSLLLARIAQAHRSGALWTPLQNFAAAERGAWYDFNDLGVLFQDTTGLVPVTTVGQSVAFVLDKSGNGNHLTQATASKRPVLANDGHAYYLQFTRASQQVLYTASTNAMAPRAQSMAVIVAYRSDDTAICQPISRSIAASGIGRWVVGSASGFGQVSAGFYQWDSVNTDLTIAGSVYLDKAIAGQIANRASGQGSVELIQSGAASALTNVMAISVGGTDYNTTYRTLIGGYGNSSNTGEINWCQGRVYGAVIRYADTVDVTLKTKTYSWMRGVYDI